MARVNERGIRVKGEHISGGRPASGEGGTCSGTDNCASGCALLVRRIGSNENIMNGCGVHSVSGREGSSASDVGSRPHVVVFGFISGVSGSDCGCVRDRGERRDLVKLVSFGKPANRPRQCRCAKTR
jgi:hypothetical protein